jgi:hypothetical protein
MTKRTIGSVTIPTRASASGEWVVKAYDTDGKRFSAADYFASDRKDAIETAAKMVQPVASVAVETAPVQPNPETVKAARETVARISSDRNVSQMDVAEFLSAMDKANDYWTTCYTTEELVSILSDWLEYKGLQNS